jgi:WD40 repeat protein/serine/threonine protein kinase
MSVSRSGQPPSTANEYPPEKPVEQWERLGRQGQRPDVRTFLAQAGDLPPAQVVEVLLRDQQERWHAGKRIPAETYLQWYPALQADDESVLDLVYGEFLLREELGERPDPADYLRRFPAQAAALQLQVELHRAIGPQAAHTVRAILSLRRAATLPGTAQPGAAREDAAAWPTVPGYQVEGVLGRGGIGVVYQAFHLGLKRRVALKLLRAGDAADPDQLARFRREAEAVAQLHHPHIVQIYEVGEHRGRPYCALEYVEGGSLDKRLAGTPQPARLAAQIVATLARAMHAAHQRNIVHRDLKPANVLLSGGAETPLSECTPKVSDFGLAKRLDVPLGQTQTGVVMGTPSYMPPEQARGQGKAVGPAADVYALGAILYEVLTGRPPFQGADMLDTLQQVVAQDPVPPRALQPKVPRDLETICLTCLQKEPGKRYASAAALAEDLERFGRGEPICARPVSTGERVWRWAKRRPAEAALLAVSVLALVGYLIVTVAHNQELQTALTAESTAKGVAQQERQKADDALKQVERQRDDINKALQQVEEQRNTIDAARRLAERQRDAARLNLYVSNLNLAHRAWGEPNVGHMRKLLEAQVPQQGEKDLRGWEWHYLWGLCHAERMVLPAYEDGHWVSYTRDGRYLIAAEWSNAITVWEADSGKRVLTCPHESPITYDLACSSDGRRLAACGSSGTWLWNLEFPKPGQPGTAPPARRLLPSSNEKVHRLAVSADGSLLATATYEGAVQVWNFPEFTWQEKTSALRLTRKVTDGGKPDRLTFSPDGSLLAYRRDNGKLLIWDTATGKEILNLNTQNKGALTFSPDGKRLILGGVEWTGAVEVATGKLFHTLAGNSYLRHSGAAVGGAAFSPDGQKLATTGFDQKIKIWDVANEKLLQTFKGHAGWVNGAAFSPDGKHLASVGKDSTLRIWEIDSRPPARDLIGHVGTIRSLAFSPDSRTLAVADSSQTVKLWDVVNARKLRTISARNGEVGCVTWSKDGRYLAIAGWDFEKPFQTVVWDRTTERELRVLPGGRRAAFSPDGTRLALGQGSGRKPAGLKVWETATGREVFAPLGPETSPGGVAFSPDGQWLATTFGQDVRICDAGTGKQILNYRDASHVGQLAISPDSRHLAWASWPYDKTAKVFDVAGRAITTVCAGHNAMIESIMFSPDGARLATGAGDHTVKIWEPATGQEMLSLPTQVGAVSALAFSPNGKLLAAGGNISIGPGNGGGFVQIWEVLPATTRTPIADPRWNAKLKQP